MVELLGAVAQLGITLILAVGMVYLIVRDVKETRRRVADMAKQRRRVGLPTRRIDGKRRVE